jgi:glycosyltransferase involved in cell wall biosynthesis
VLCVVKSDSVFIFPTEGGILSLRILYVHPAAAFGGASKSLLELFRGFPEGSVQATVICPFGTAADHFRVAGMNVITCVGLSSWDNTRYSHYRGLRWLVLLRELRLLLPSLKILSRTLSQNEFDIIHVNEITVLPIVAIATRHIKTPLVVHVRSLQNRDSSGLICRALFRILLRTAAIVAIDETVARTLPAGLPVTIIHNGIRPTEVVLKPVGQGRPFGVALVGVLLHSKGVIEFIRAARICRDRGLDVEFLLAGENPRHLSGFRKWLFNRLNFAHDVRAEVEAYIEEHELGSVIKVLGFVDDVQNLYRHIDLLCFPSHLDAAGRPVFEAAFCGVPSLVAAVDPEPDTIIDNQTGLCIEARNPQAIADKVEHLIKNPKELLRLGSNARQLALKNFDILKNAGEMLMLYENVLKQGNATDRP